MFHHNTEKNPAGMHGAELASALSRASSRLARILNTAMAALSENRPKDALQTENKISTAAPAA